MTRYAAKKRGKRGERKREYGKRKEKRKIKAGSHERLTRRAYTKGREMYRRVERKGTKKKRGRKKGRRGKKKMERGNTTVSGSGLQKESDVKMAAYVYWLFVFLNEFTRLNESSP